MAVKKLHTRDLFVCIGKVLKPFGIQGALKIQNFSDIPDRFESLDFIYIGPSIDLAVPYQMEAVEYHNRYIILYLLRYTDRNIAESLQGYYCYIPKTQQEELPEDNFYVDDLLGIKVLGAEGNDIGTVSDVISNPANDVLVVDTQGGEALIPMVADIIHEIDLDKGTIIVQLIEGMLEDYRVG
jgi:16S rRNA processing protein RimM